MPFLAEAERAAWLATITLEPALRAFAGYLADLEQQFRAIGAARCSRATARVSWRHPVALVRFSG